MTRFLKHLFAVILALWLPVGAWACEYSAPVRLISATLTSVLESGGQVSTFHQARLRQALRRMDVVAVQRQMADALEPTDRNAAVAVLTLSSALAIGDEQVLSASDRDHATHFAAAIRTSCLAETLATSQNTATGKSLEQGEPQVDGGVLSGLTFRQGIARLSLIFTVYMTFLALVIGLRRGRKNTIFSIPENDAPPPGGRAFSPRQNNEVSGF